MHPQVSGLLRLPRNATGNNATHTRGPCPLFKIIEETSWHTFSSRDSSILNVHSRQGSWHFHWFNKLKRNNRASLDNALMHLQESFKS